MVGEKGDGCVGVAGVWVMMRATGSSRGKGGAG